MSRWLLKLFKDGNSTSSLDNLCLYSGTLTVKRWLLMFKQNFLCFSLCPFVSGALTGHDWKETLSLLFAPSLELFVYTKKIPTTLFFFQLSSPSSLSLPSYDACLDLLTIFVTLCWTHSRSFTSLVYWKAQHWTKLSRWGLSRTEKRKDHLL